VTKDCAKALLHALDSDDQLIFANAAFDLSVGCAADHTLLPVVFDAYDNDRIVDVLIRQKLIDIALGEYQQHGKYSLAAIAKRLLNIHVEKEETWRLRYWELVNVPLDEWPREAIKYSLTDSEITRQVYYAQEKELAEVDRLCVLADQYRQGRADFALKLISAWGLKTDPEGVARLRQTCETEQAKLQEELLEAKLLRWIKKKGVQTISKCVRVAQERMLSLNPEARLTATGQKKKCREIKYISVDAEACEDSGDPLLEKYTRYSQLGNLLSGHVKAMEKGIVTPIHTYFEVLQDTGRTGSSGPNVQNVRRAPGARECFVPRPGWAYVACDFDKAELHTLAQVCINLFGRSNLADVLNNGFDPHVGLGARIAGMTYDDLLAAVKAGDPVAKENRQRAKPGNFGFPGGMGPGGMVRYAKKAYRVILTLDESTELHNGWKEEYPEVAYDYLNWIRDLTSAEGYATIEHFDSGRWRGRVPFCTAANSFFQGMAADAMKVALWAVIKKCYTRGSALFGCRVVNEIHDEFLLEVPIPRVSDAAWELRDTMVEAYNTYTRDVPVNATPAAMDRWSKKAETIVDNNGNLQIWRYAA
jgi:DNA polymerase I-like protein with 3'-5' exonuclease and polymerase domains